MGINFYSKRFLKLLSLSLIIPLSLLEINTVNNQIKAEKNFIAASEKDLFLYRQTVSYTHLTLPTKA